MLNNQMHILGGFGSRILFSVAINEARDIGHNSKLESSKGFIFKYRVGSSRGLIQDDLLERIKNPK